jgi:hypothetical protein
MALAYAIKGRGSSGDMSERIVDITMDAAYAAGGYTLDPRGLGFGQNGVILAVIPMTSNGFLCDFVPSTGKLMVRDMSGGVGAATPEVAPNLAGLNGLVVRCLVFGKGSPG